MQKAIPVEAVKKYLSREIDTLSDTGIYKALPCNSTSYVNIHNVSNHSTSTTTITFYPGKGSLSLPIKHTFDKRSAAAVTANGFIVLTGERYSSSPLHHVTLNSSTSQTSFAHTNPLILRQQTVAVLIPSAMLSLLRILLLVHCVFIALYYRHWHDWVTSTIKIKAAPNAFEYPKSAYLYFCLIARFGNLQFYA